MEYKKTLYDLLEIVPSASETEIEAAYLGLSGLFASGEHNLEPREAERQHTAISQAYWTLSDKARRAFYDASLASRGSPVQLAVEIREPRWTPQKILLMVIGSLIAVGMVIQIAFMLMAYRQSQKMINGRSTVEERVIAEEYRQTTTGGRSASEIAEDRAAAEQRRVDQDRREQEMRQVREMEESRRYADRVSSELRHAEENARREAEYEKQKRDQEEQHKQQEEEIRLQNLKRQWR